jgi:L-alanine-DL-glutamate epimerase-like enolase superfamily enzyme
MKITDIKISNTFYVPCAPQQDAITSIPGLNTHIFCEIFTDEGLTGFVPASGGNITKVLIEELLKPYVVGEDPMNNERIWSKMYWGSLAGGRRGATVTAMGIIDNAIWDLKGKITGQPLHKLLGGFQNEVNSYGSGINLNLSDDQLVKQMAGFVHSGFKMVKMKIGHQDPKRDIERVRRVREAIGPDIDLSLDANNAWSLSTAIQMAKKLGAYNIYWLEEPILADEISNLATLARETDIPIAIGENHYTKWEFKQLIEQGAVDIVQADVTKCGGVTEFMKIAAMADAHGLPVCPHFSNFTDVPCVAAVPNGLFHEYAEEMFEPASLLLKDCAKPSGGMIAPLDKPGFGIELDPDAAQEFARKPENASTGRSTARGWRWAPYL